MDISHMTPEERSALKAQIDAQEKADKQKREDDIAAYKSMTDEFCRAVFDRMKAISDTMRAAKHDVFNSATVLIEQKEQLFSAKIDRRSDTFTSSDGQLTVSLGYRTTDSWDDTVNAGVAKVNTFIASLAKDDESKALTEMVMRLLAKDRKGNLKASRVLELRAIAQKSGYVEFLEAVDIIQAAHRPVDSCQYISVEYKDENGVRHALPLSLAAMDKSL